MAFLNPSAALFSGHKSPVELLQNFVGHARCIERNYTLSLRTMLTIGLVKTVPACPASIPTRDDILGFARSNKERSPRALRRRRRGFDPPVFSPDVGDESGS
jgi:hypothetical protein